MLPFAGDYGSGILDTVESVCEVGIDIYRLSSGMGWEIVFELAEGAEDGCVSSLLVNGYPDSLFAAPGAREDGW